VFECHVWTVPVPERDFPTTRAASASVATADLTQNSILLCGGTTSQSGSFTYAGHDGNFSHFNFSHCRASVGTVGFEVACFENNTLNRFVLWNCSGGWVAFFFGGQCYLNYFSLYHNTVTYSLLHLNSAGLVRVSYSNIDQPVGLVVNALYHEVEFMNCYFSGAFPSVGMSTFVTVDCLSFSSTSVAAHGTDTLKCPVTETLSPMASPTRSHSPTVMLSDVFLVSEALFISPCAASAFSARTNFLTASGLALSIRFDQLSSSTQLLMSAALRPSARVSESSKPFTKLVISTASHPSTRLADSSRPLTQFLPESAKLPASGSILRQTAGPRISGTFSASANRGWSSFARQSRAAIATAKLGETAGLAPTAGCGTLAPASSSLPFSGSPEFGDPSAHFASLAVNTSAALYRSNVFAGSTPVCSTWAQTLSQAVKLTPARLGPTASIASGMAVSDLMMVSDFVRSGEGRQRSPFGPSSPLVARHTPTLWPSVSSTSEAERDSSLDGGFSPWIPVGIVLGVVVLGIGAFAAYRAVSRRVPAEPPPPDDRAEWFEHQEREQLQEIAFEFQNPIAIQTMESLAQLSDMELGEVGEDERL
jgi:hypothetical protein